MLICQRNLLDAIVNFHEISILRQVQALAANPRHSSVGYVRTKVRRVVTELLPRPGFLEALRESLPSTDLDQPTDEDDFDYWRVAVQLEHILNPSSDIDIDDAASLARFAAVMAESILASLRGG
jgi:hypothetical protein